MAARPSPKGSTGRRQRRLLAGGKVGRALLFAPKTFGVRAEVESATAIALAEQLESVLFSIEWVGSVGPDTQRLVSSLSSDPIFPRDVFVDARQSIWNWQELCARIRKEFLLVPELMVDGKPVYEPKPMLGFIGTGHFLDGTVAFELAGRIGIADVHERLALRVSPDELGTTDAGLRAAVAETFDHRAKLARTACPVLVLHTRDDGMVERHHAEALAGWAGARAELVVYDQGSHNTIHAFHGRDILRRVTSYAVR